MDIFVRSLLTDKVKVRARQISKGLKETLTHQLKRKFEGVCSHHGYIKPDSIEIYKYSMGRVVSVSLNGDVNYQVQFFADVCNPVVGSLVQVRVVNSNKFGILTQATINYRGVTKPVLDVVLARSEQNLDKYAVGDSIAVEIVGKRFTLGQDKISALGKVSKKQGALENILDQTDSETDDETMADDDIVEVESEDGAGSDDTDEENDKEQTESVVSVEDEPDDVQEPDDNFESEDFNDDNENDDANSEKEDD
jgi:DNA-directed RNA polymerase subunit E'/Rpb7